VRTAVILAGGLGTRLQPLTNIIPKPLLPIGQSTVLEVQILALKRHGFAEVIIATNYMSDYLESVVGDGNRYGVAVTISRETERLGTCGPLSLVKQRLSEPFIVMNGDVLTTLDLRAFADFSGSIHADLTVGTTQFVTPFRFGRVLSSGGYLTGVEEKPEFTTEILAGIYGMKPAILELIPERTYFGIDDLIRLMLSSERPIAKYLIRDYWVDIGQLSDYELAKETYQIEEARRRAPQSSAKTST
jgi:NDP-mannose synthase